MKQYTFSREAAQQIQQTVRRSERVTSVAKQQAAGVHQVRIAIAQTGAGGIAALSGTTPGSGVVTLYRINSDGDLESLGVSVTAYNLASSAVAANTWVQVKQETASGRLLIDFEDCG